MPHKIYTLAELAPLLTAANLVVDRWERGDLAEAVRLLRLALDNLGQRWGGDE